MRKRAVQILRTVADYRVLSLKQLTSLSFPSENATRAWIHKHKDLIETREAPLTGRTGRPERVVSLTSKAVGLLQKEGDSSIAPEKRWVSPEQIGHQLLANTIRIQAIGLESRFPQFSVSYLSPNSPYHLDEQGNSRLFHKITLPHNDITFIPDGTFTICESITMKSLLFFVEADMSTESYTSKKEQPNDLQTKVGNYRMFRAQGCYKRYEQIFNQQLHGFRVLLVANTTERANAIARFLKNTPPAGFVWVTSQKLMVERYIWEKIWAPGGGKPLESILGRRYAPIRGNLAQNDSSLP